MKDEKRSLKVLTINTVPFMRGGISTVIINYYENMDTEKIHMDFVVNREIETEYRDKLETGGSHVYLLERNTKLIKYFFRLLAIIRKEDYDIVHVHGNSCTMAIELFAAMLCGCKKRIAHSHNSVCDHKTAHRLLRPIFEASCTERLACSEEAGKWLFLRKKYTVIENAMNLEKYRFDANKRTDIRKRIGAKEADILLGHVGWFNEQKNQKFLVDILEKLVKESSQYKLILVGDGNELKREIEEYVREKGFNKFVTFYGGTNDVAGVMSAMDVFLFPSKWEGLGIAMIEAQMTGLPCIASMQVPEVTKITDNCQYLELSAPITTWCKAVKKMQKQKIDRLKTEISEEGKKRFDINEQIGKLEEIYLE